VELIERLERFLGRHLRKVVRVGSVAGERVGKAPEARPDGGKLGIERQRGRHCTSCG
jgi:hypothetical protein